MTTGKNWLAEVSSPLTEIGESTGSTRFEPTPRWTRPLTKMERKWPTSHITKKDTELRSKTRLKKWYCLQWKGNRSARMESSKKFKMKSIWSLNLWISRAWVITKRTISDLCKMLRDIQNWPPKKEWRSLGSYWKNSRLLRCMKCIPLKPRSRDTSLISRLWYMETMRQSNLRMELLTLEPKF